jgi:aryl-alcohol dehydrogenase-like predicted oxidoreductase
MEYVRLGKSELEVSRVILGTWALGGWKWGGLTGNEPEAAIRASLDRGINTLDTAPMYGFGLSEELVGRAIKGRQGNSVSRRRTSKEDVSRYSRTGASTPSSRNVTEA